MTDGPRSEAIEAMLVAIGEEFDREIAHRETRGGQQVTHTGDFASVGPSALNAMKRWSRDFRRVLALPLAEGAKPRPSDVLAEAVHDAIDGERGLESAVRFEPMAVNLASIVATALSLDPRESEAERAVIEAAMTANGWSEEPEETRGDLAAYEARLRVACRALRDVRHAESWRDTGEVRQDSRVGDFAALGALCEGLKIILYANQVVLTDEETARMIELGRHI